MSFWLLIGVIAGGLLLGFIMGSIWDRAKVDWSRDEEPVVPPPNRLKHEIKVGKPGSGKSTAARNDILKAVQAREEFIMVADPHGLLTDDVLADLLADGGHEERIEVLDLTFPDRLFGLDLMPYSQEVSEGRKRMEDDRIIESFAQILTRERNLNLNAAPFTGTWTRNALKLRQRQEMPVPLRWVPYALVCGHPIQLHMIRHCTDDRLKQEFLNILDMKNVHGRETIISPAKRLMEPFFENPFADGMLSVPPIDLYEWQKQKILLVRANSLVSPTVMRGVMCMLFVRLMQNAALHFAITGETLPTRIWLDEFIRLHPGAMEVDLLEQCRKWGVGVTMLIQYIPDDPIFKALVNATNRFEIFPMGEDSAADFVSKQVATFLLDSKKVKNEELRERNIVRGFNRVPRADQ